MIRVSARRVFSAISNAAKTEETGSSWKWVKRGLYSVPLVVPSLIYGRLAFDEDFVKYADEQFPDKMKVLRQYVEVADPIPDPDLWEFDPNLSGMVHVKTASGQSYSIPNQGVLRTEDELMDCIISLGFSKDDKIVDCTFEYEDASLSDDDSDVSSLPGGRVETGFTEAEKTYSTLSFDSVGIQRGPIKALPSKLVLDVEQLQPDAADRYRSAAAAAAVSRASQREKNRSASSQASTGEDVEAKRQQEKLEWELAGLQSKVTALERSKTTTTRSIDDIDDDIEKIMKRIADVKELLPKKTKYFFGLF